MSLSRQYRIRCDKCGKHEIKLGWYTSPRKARSDYRRLGWQRYVKNGNPSDEDNADLCPECAKTWQPPAELAPNRQVAYLPPHVNPVSHESLWHPDVQYGFILTIDQQLGKAFCLFWEDKHGYRYGKDRVKTTAKTVKLNRLLRYRCRNKQDVEWAIQVYEETLRQP